MAPEEAATLEDHLEHCASCHRLDEELRQLQQDFSLLRVEPPARLTGRIMAGIRAEAVPTTSISPPIKPQKAFRRWFSAAAAFLIMITATLMGSQVLNLNPETPAAPAAVRESQRNRAALPEAVHDKEGCQTVSIPPASEAETPAQAVPAEDLPKTRPVTTQPIIDSSGAATGGGSGLYSVAGNTESAASLQADNTAPWGTGALDESNDTGIREANGPQAPSPERGDAHEGSSETEQPASEAQLLPLEFKAAEALLRQYLDLPSPASATVTYEGPASSGDAHLFRVLWPEGRLETYSVDCATATVTPLPDGDSPSSAAP